MPKLLKYLGLFFSDAAKSVVKKFSAQDLSKKLGKREAIVVFGRIVGIDEFFLHSEKQNFKKKYKELRRQIFTKVLETEGIIFEFSLSSFLVLFAKLETYGVDIHKNAIKFAREITASTVDIFEEWSKLTKIVEVNEAHEQFRQSGIAIGIESGMLEFFVEHNRLIMFGAPLIWAKRLAMCQGGEIAVNNALRYRLEDGEVEKGSLEYLSTFVFDFKPVEIKTNDFPAFTAYILKHPQKLRKI